jgi:hypothetical protein
MSFLSWLSNLFPKSKPNRISKKELLTKAQEEIELRMSKKMRDIEDNREKNVQLLKLKIFDAMVKGEESVLYYVNRADISTDTDLTEDMLREDFSDFDLYFYENKCLISWN